MCYFRCSRCLEIRQHLAQPLSQSVYPQSLQESPAMAPGLGHNCFLPNPFQFILPTDGIYSVMLKTPLNNSHRTHLQLLEHSVTTSGNTPSVTGTVNGNQWEHSFSYWNTQWQPVGTQLQLLEHSMATSGNTASVTVTLSDNQWEHSFSYWSTQWQPVGTQCVSVIVTICTARCPPPPTLTAQLPDDTASFSRCDIRELWNGTLGH
jgi:hypothetical protein